MFGGIHDDYSCFAIPLPAIFLIEWLQARMLVAGHDTAYGVLQDPFTSSGFAFINAAIIFERWQTCSCRSWDLSLSHCAVRLIAGVVFASASVILQSNVSIRS